MSLENAILAHATALEKLAEAIKAAFGNVGTAALATIVPAGTKELVGVSGVKPDAELDEAVEQVEKASTPARKAINDALAAAKAGTKGKAGNAEKPAEEAKSDEQKGSGAGSSDEDAEPLDYTKDVRPVLLAAIKKVGKDPVQELIKTYGVDKADKMDPAQYPDIVAKAQAL